MKMACIADHPDLPTMLNNLGNVLERRYECTGQVTDLEMAIEKAEEAVGLAPSDHPDLAVWLNNLGNVLEIRYERTGQVADLEMAIDS
jgi:Tetratricopeptide repeat